jgi:hypothetical protein
MAEDQGMALKPVVVVVVVIDTYVACVKHRDELAEGHTPLHCSTRIALRVES